MIQYRFTLLDEHKEKVRELRIFYGSDFFLEKEREKGEVFFRSKIEYTFTAVGDSFNVLTGLDWSTKNYVQIEQKTYEIDWTTILIGEFVFSSVNIDFLSNKCTFSIKSLDAYTDIMDSYDTMFNLEELQATKEIVEYRMRPILQIMTFKNTQVTCLGSSSSYDLTANSTLKKNKYENYNFFLNPPCLAINVTLDGGTSDTYKFAGMYVGVESQPDSNDTKVFKKVFIREGTREDAVRILMSKGDGSSTERKVVLEWRQGGETSSLWIPGPSGTYHGSVSSQTTIHFSGDSRYARYTGKVKRFDVLCRYLLYNQYIINYDANGASPILPIECNEVPDGDIVSNHTGYPYCYKADFNGGFPFVVSNQMSNENTQWGMSSTKGLFFMPPEISEGVDWVPVCRDAWKEFSVWLPRNVDFSTTKFKSREDFLWNLYQFKDAVSVSEVISRILQKIAPNVTHLPTAEYSTFLYSKNNRISKNRQLKLMITPKSNLLHGDIYMHDTHTEVSLKDITGLLKNSLNCYWYIEDDKFIIEHLYFFENGGSYDPDDERNIIDLTTFVATNGRHWAFTETPLTIDTSTLWSEKGIKWMDSGRDIFDGIKMNALDRYAVGAPKQDMDLAKFTSDLDYVLTNPDAISQEGFFVFFVKDKQILNYNPIYSSGNKCNMIPIRVRYGYRYYFLTNPEDEATYRGYVSEFSEDGTELSNQIISTDGFYPENEDVCWAYIKFSDIQYANKCIGVACDEINTVPLYDDAISQFSKRYQNYYLNPRYLYEDYHLYDCPGGNISIDGKDAIKAITIGRFYSSRITFPYGDIKEYSLIKTFNGVGVIDKIRVNLNSLSNELTISYSTMDRSE